MRRAVIYVIYEKNVIYAERSSLVKFWATVPGQGFCRAGVLKHFDSFVVIYVIYAAATH
jgi:hypothetical protein